ncbi:Ubiquitin-conjugating enzyme [Mycena chlorophos]|uniref:Ubiquitin-conjugating enzyme n=1 Tax=Mycena chlorophos TaxID=658473 RepID=A0A8H6WMB6_MYCCL|nr:Ubiquitin-conjugating enzyme [Mycena chlorophos]
MASRLSRQVLSTSSRVSRSLRSNAQVSRRCMSADAHTAFKAPSDIPWIIGAAVVTIPTVGYLLKDTMAIKARIAEGHHEHAHGHDDSHAEHHEEPAAHPVMLKDGEGKEEDVSGSVKAAESADAPPAAASSKDSDDNSDAASEPPKDEKEESK